MQFAPQILLNQFHKKYLPWLCSCARISFVGKHMSAMQRQRQTNVCLKKTVKTNVCAEKTCRRRSYADREAWLRYAGKKRLLCSEAESRSGSTAQGCGSQETGGVREAVDAVGISRSSFYKYKDDIFPFYENSQGTTITLTFQMDDETGLLSDVLKIVADCGANILTIHQSIPINGVASLSLSVQVLPTTGDVSEMIESMEAKSGVRNVKILARE